MKEIIISIVIIICILLGNVITQKYTNYATEYTTEQLSSLKEKMMSNDKNLNDELKKEINKIYEDWYQKSEKLAYYIEHNQLEKIEIDLTTIKSYIETEEYNESVGKTDETIYLLSQLKDKNNFCLKNIF